MKTKRNLKNGLVRKNNSKGLCFVAVAICCMLVFTSSMAAVTGVSKSQNNAITQRDVDEKVVSPRDIGLVKYHYGCDPTLSEFEQYDINKDGVIDPDDVAYLERHGLCEPLQVPQVDTSVQHMDADFSAAEVERAAAAPLSPDVVWVDDDFDPSTPGWGVDHFSSIQDGVDAVAEDGQVLVSSGIYEEQVTISKSLSLLGEDEESTVIQYSGSSDYTFVVKIWGDYDVTLDDVTVDGFTLQGNRNGVMLWAVDHCTISNCTIQCGLHGVDFSVAQYNVIRDCSISGAAHGIHMDSDLYMGGIAFCSFNSIINNWIYDNQIAIMTFSAWGHNYWYDYHYDNIVQGNFFESNGDGVDLCFACYNEISYNIMQFSGVGLCDLSSDEPAYGNTVHHNNFLYGCSVMDYSGNNYWYDPVLSEGNYWVFGCIEDADGDRIDDYPYPICDWSGYVTTWDLYPLMFPWGELPPVAQFTYSLVEGLTIQFDASDSFDRDGDIVTYSWDFDDDTIFETVDPVVEHTYLTCGEYNVTLTVVDDDGQISSVSEDIILTSPPCPWDVNFDGMVDPVDVGLVKYYYGQDPSIPAYSVYDVNLDGVIDPVDVGLVKYYYGPCPTC